MGKSFCQVDITERRLVKNMVKEGLTWSAIQKITGRTPDTISSILKAATPKPPKGAPVKFKSKDVDKLVKTIEAMVKDAKAQKEVTLDMILKKAGCGVCKKTARKGLKQRNVAFFKLKEKPLLEPGDVTDRKKWADDHKHRSATQWVFR
jgi:predicted transcriptional regulator